MSTGKIKQKFKSSVTLCISDITIPENIVKLSHYFNTSDLLSLTLVLLFLTFPAEISMSGQSLAFSVGSSTSEGYHQSKH